MMTLLLVAAAAAYLLWPANSKSVPSVEQMFTLPTPTPAKPAEPDPRAAIDSLLEVRDRLAASQQLDGEASKAVDTLWLDLLHGSQKK